MKRRIPGLSQQASNSDFSPEGLFLVRVEQAAYRYDPLKPFFTVRFSVLEPELSRGRSFSGRLYCTQKALWKLGWFLRDFGYDTDLLGRDEVDEKALLGLKGIVRVSQTRLNGRSYLNLESFAPSGEWEELSTEVAARTTSGLEEGDDL
jgi:hypothetical protein